MSEPTKKTVGTAAKTADEARAGLKAKTGTGGAAKGSKGGSPKTFIIVMAIIGVITVVIMWKLMSPSTKESTKQEISEVQPESVDNVSKGILQTEPSYDQSAQQPAAFAQDTNFVVDESIVFKDQVSNQYMIMYKEKAYEITSDLGQQAVAFYKTQNIDALFLLKRLQEREASGNVTNVNNTGAPNAGVEDPVIAAQTKAAQNNSILQAQNQELEGLVKLQDETINQLKQSIKAATAQNKAASVKSTSGVDQSPIPKGAKPIKAFAVVGDIAWIETVDKKQVQVSVGDQLPGGLKVYNINSAKSIVWAK